MIPGAGAVGKSLPILLLLLLLFSLLTGEEKSSCFTLSGNVVYSQHCQNISYSVL